MGHKPWDRPWKRAEKAKAKREWRDDIIPEDEWVDVTDRVAGPITVTSGRPEPPQEEIDTADD